MTEIQYKRFLNIIKSIANNYDKIKNNNIKLIDKDNNFIDFTIKNNSEHNIKSIIYLKLKALEKINKRLDFDNDIQIKIYKKANDNKKRKT